jgi:type II restriction enzyme
LGGHSDSGIFTVRLSMNPMLALAYKSRCQIARVVTEAWAAENLYCPSCSAERLVRSSANTRAVDFRCDWCREVFQLKGGAKWSERRIPDAGYEAMIAAIRSDTVPNLFVMQYSPCWHVHNLLLVPSFFFTESAIEKRKPLGPKARRAGWVGCNICLGAIAPEGKLRIVSNGAARSANEVRSEYRKVRPLAALKRDLRGWTLNVLRLIHGLKTRFILADLYALESTLAQVYPGNHNIRPKIRQQLQILRDLGLITFLGHGEYAKCD